LLNFDSSGNDEPFGFGDSDRPGRLCTPDLEPHLEAHSLRQSPPPHWSAIHGRSPGCGQVIHERRVPFHSSSDRRGDRGVDRSFLEKRTPGVVPRAAGLHSSPGCRHPRFDIRASLQSHGARTHQRVQYRAPRSVAVRTPRFRAAQRAADGLGHERCRPVRQPSGTLQPRADRAHNAKLCGEAEYPTISASWAKSLFFILAFTGGTHFPWEYPDYSNSALDIVGKIEGPERSRLKTYVNAERVTDNSLKKLIAYFEKTKEKTLILAMGDHLPHLGEIYQDNGFFKGSFFSGIFRHSPAKPERVFNDLAPPLRRNLCKSLCSDGQPSCDRFLNTYHQLMYLRRCYRNKDGKRHSYWALVESHHTVRGPRQRVVAWLGELDEHGRLAIRQGRRGLGIHLAVLSAFQTGDFSQLPRTAFEEIENSRRVTSSNTHYGSE
jgi:hypothetical protein